MNILDKIVAARAKRLDEKKSRVKERSMHRSAGEPLPFFNTATGVTLIAECKKGSPSRGVFVEDYDPVVIAGQYERGGADALSVLTEPDFFFGDDAHLAAVKRSVSLPVLRKDFIFDPYQVTESWALGADAILLIASLLSKSQLKELTARAAGLGMEVLLEVHSGEELQKVSDIPVHAIGVNARNLKDFSVDFKAIKTLCAQIPQGRIAVAESGIKGINVVKELYNAGYRGFLVGEYFITAADREKKVAEVVKALQEKL